MSLAGAGLGDPHTLPAPTAIPLLSHRPPWLGVEMSTAAGVVPVKHVIRSSPADRAGLRDGDEISKVDGQSVASPAEVTRFVTSHTTGDRIDVTYKRSGVTQTVSVTLTPRPSTDDIMRMEYVGTFAPALTSLAAASGALPASMNALRGKVAVIEFWATWCGPCQLTMPVLDGWQSRYGAQGLSVIGITTEPVQMAATFATQKALHYAIASDSTSATSLAFGVRNIPTLFIVDKRGVVREVSMGYDPAANTQIETLLQKLLAEPAPQTTTP
jgi:thiol-disulfide isomerase/thioredoxin